MLDDAREIEVMRAKGAEEPRLRFVKLAGDDVRHAFARIPKAVEQEEMMDERRRIPDAGADEDGATTDGPKGEWMYVPPMKSPTATRVQKARMPTRAWRHPGLLLCVE